MQTISQTSMEQLSGGALANEIARQFSLGDAASGTLRRALEHVDQVYETGHAINAGGKRCEIGLSPVPRIEGRALMALAIEHDAQRTLEVGLSFGMSALHLLLAQEVSGGELHVAIDPFQDSDPYFGCGRAVVEQQGLSKRFRLLEGPSAWELPELARRNESFDLCFVDGSHIFSDMFVDAYFCNQMLRPGGLLVLHDAWMTATRTLCNILTSNLGYVHDEQRSIGMLAVLRNESEGSTDWRNFQEAFVPFEVVKDGKRHRSRSRLRRFRKWLRRATTG